MEIGLGVLKWTPETFWKSTMFELCAAVDGFLEISGAKTGADIDYAELETLRDKNRRGEKWR